MVSMAVAVSASGVPVRVRLATHGEVVNTGAVTSVTQRKSPGFKTCRTVESVEPCIFIGWDVDLRYDYVELSVMCSCGAFLNEITGIGGGRCT